MRLRLRRAALLVAVAALLAMGGSGCQRSSPSCDPLIYGDLPCL